jgi:hypothetical protein
VIPAVERVWALVSGLPTKALERTLMMLLQSYADDSGSDPQSHTFVLGGLIALPTEWVAFTEDWQTALDSGTIKIDYFKMSEAMSLQGQFSMRRGWTDAARDAKVTELVEIIVKRTRYGAWVSMRQEDFRNYFQSIPLPERNITTDAPHTYMITQFIAALCAHADKNRADCSFEFVFDDQLGVDVEIALWWPHLKVLAAQQGWARYVGPAPVFRDEKCALPLQAADLFAWEHRNHQTRNRLLMVPPSNWLRRLCTIPTVHVTFDKESLTSINRVLLPLVAEFVAQNPTVPMLSAGKKARRQTRRSKKKLAKKSSSSKKARFS